MDSQLDLAKLRRKVELEIDEYVYEVPEGSIGNPWSPDKVARKLCAFRDALVDPYWVDILDDDKKRKPSVVVADDKMSNLLVFEPGAQKFMLVMRKKEGSDLISFGVDGDAVGCFLAR